MAKVQGPLFSLRATGTLAGTLVFQGRAGSTAVFPRKSPYDPKSEGQLMIRDYISRGVYYWQHIGATYQAVWNEFIT